MIGWFQALLPKEAKFYDLFEQHAATLVAGARALDRLLSAQGNAAENGAMVFEQENRADQVTREVMLAVRRTFITPFDRGDIQELIASMDDAIDQMQKTVKAISLYEVIRFEPAMTELGKIIVNAAEKIEVMVPLLRATNDNSGRINALVEEITHIEEKSDELHDQGLKALFVAHRTVDTMAFIVGAEIYDHLEKVVDRFEDVANRISGIVIEHI